MLLVARLAVLIGEALGLLLLGRRLRLRSLLVRRCAILLGKSPLLLLLLLQLTLLLLVLAAVRLGHRVVRDAAALVEGNTEVGRAEHTTRARLGRRYMETRLGRRAARGTTSTNTGKRFARAGDRLCGGDRA